MASLPLEIIDDEIFTKLPPKSLIRFKSVSKQFNSLISSPNFINLHLINSLSSDANRLVLINHRGPRLIDLENTKSPPSPIPTPASFQPHPINPIASSCNGLLLIRGVNMNQYLLTNPCTGLYSFLMVPATPVGFGYDPYADDYKIVSIETTGSMLVYSVTNEIYRFLSNNNNNSKEHETIMNRIALHDPVVFNGRFIHWLIWCPELKKHRIICFDIWIESWTVDVPVPNYNGSSSGYDSSMHYAEILFDVERDKQGDLTKLRVFEGCLCVLAASTVSPKMDVWVMKEYGVVGSWVKLFTVPKRNYAPLAYVRGSSSKVLLHRDRGSQEGQLLSYDIQTEKPKKAYIHYEHGVGNFYQGCMFKGSLVNLPQNRVHED